jgi:hypothetical protein
MDDVGHMGDTEGSWPDGCGNGRWCPSCRQEIREEALLWLRELNVLPRRKDEPLAPIISTRWHREWLLADLGPSQY